MKSRSFLTIHLIFHAGYLQNLPLKLYSNKFVENLLLLNGLNVWKICLANTQYSSKYPNNSLYTLLFKSLKELDFEL